MDKKTKEVINVALGSLIGVILVLCPTWIIFNIIVWLICLCFHIAFDFLLGTGLWLCYLLLWFTLKSTNN